MEAILQRAHKFVKVRLITPYSAATHWTPSGLQHNMIHITVQMIAIARDRWKTPSNAGLNSHSAIGLFAKKAAPERDSEKHKNTASAAGLLIIALGNIAGIHLNRI